MTYADPRKYGYVHMSLSKDMRQALDEIQKEEMCISRTETLRRVIAFYKKAKNPKNAAAGI